MESERDASRLSGGGGRLLLSTIGRSIRPQSWLHLLYLLLAIPLGVLYPVMLIGGLTLGLVLSVVLVGVPILLSVLGTAHVLAAFERATARRLLGVEIPSPGYPFLEPDDERERLRALVFGIGTYMVLCFLATKALVGAVALALVSTLLAGSVGLLAAPLYYDRTAHLADALGEPVGVVLFDIAWNQLLVGLEAAVRVVASAGTSLPRAAGLSLVGLLVLVVSLQVCNAVARLVGQFSRVFLGPFGSTPGAAADETDRRANGRQ
ncbi:sensor domain-containing protein [Halopiger goleimassiliensis]|uniref:sensor domain-containing protein n=1 Tax=Halopiger goleimassiliensis TaxID=1293048 RepID=UPI000677B0EA|nr:sensor domain-containing protein [Halopiger goleimassiliensis]